MTVTVGGSNITFSDSTTQSTAGAWSQSANGYRKLPDGTIIQWGSVTTVTNSSVTVTLPISFPSSCASVVATGSYSGADYAYNITSKSTTQFVLFHQGSSNTSYWMAIGY